MLFWIVAAGLTAGVVLLLVPPLLRSRAVPETAGGRAHDLEVYRDQLAELDHDRARGLIGEGEAAAARAEIGRRMLAAADLTEPAPSAPPSRRGRRLAVVLALGLPLSALAVYLPLGRPDLPARPYADRNLQAERTAPGPEVLDALEKLKAHLAANPGDLEGWTVLAQVYGRMGRWTEGTDAMRRAVALAPDDAEISAAYAEMLINANGGTVPEDARRILDGVLTKTPKEPRARFYRALARQQAGDTRAALEEWRGLAADAPADAPWLPAVRARIAAAAEELGLDAAALMPPTAAPQPPAPNAPAGSANGREQMIRGMVDGLAARLRQAPDDVDGWLRLARSYIVLGEREKAAAAAREAAGRAPQRTDALLMLAEALTPASLNDPQAKPTALPAEAVAALQAVLKLDPDNRDALWVLGMDAANTGRRDEAATLWTRLLGQLNPNDPDHAFVRQRIEALKTGG